MIDKKRVGEYLKKLRYQKKGLNGKTYTQFDLVREFSKHNFEISNNAIAEWESGASLPNPDNLEMLAKIYNRSIDEILDGEDRIVKKYEEIYIISKDKWYLNFDYEKYNLNQIKNEQIKLVTLKFKELVNIIIDRNLTYNEDQEFRFLFTHFYSLSDYAKEYISIDTNDEYLIFKNSIAGLLYQIRSMTKKEKYWEIQKLYKESKIIEFKFNDVLDLNNEEIIKERFDILEDWQKDMLLAMYQNIEPSSYNPSDFGAQALKNYEIANGEYNINKIRRNEIKELIIHGACLNKMFFNKIRHQVKYRRIIDRLEELYELCLKPITVDVENKNREWKTYKIENNQKNRFLSKYYLYFSMEINGKFNENYDDIEEIYNWLINNNEIAEDFYLKLAEKKNINVNENKKYWMAELKRQTQIDKYFINYKKTEKRIQDGLIEIENLKDKLKTGMKEYQYYEDKIIGGSTEDTIRNNIEDWKSEIEYTEYLNGRDETLTQKLLEEIDCLTFEEIRNKYFKIEVERNE